MREIKFQAIRKDTKERFDVLCIYWLHSAIFLGGSMCDIQLDQVDLIQFTGLTDVNGVEIYEGDIVFRNYNRLGRMVVEYSDGNHNMPSASVVSSRFKIIGNIHEGE